MTVAYAEAVARKARRILALMDAKATAERERLAAGLPRHLTSEWWTEYGNQFSRVMGAERAVSKAKEEARGARLW